MTLKVSTQISSASIMALMVTFSLVRVAKQVQEVYFAQATNFHHDAVGVPKHADPFTGKHEHYAFQSALAYSQEHGMVPSGYGLLHSEWDKDSYPSFEILQSGQCEVVPNST